MKFKKNCFSTILCELYGKNNYQSHIEVNREYWYYFFGDCDICNTYGTGWYKIKVTYIRSKCMFYIFSDYPDIEEEFCSINCYMASHLTFAEIDPVKDVGEIIDNESTKKLCCFNNEHTIVRNWDNSDIVEVEENDKDYLLALIICTKL